MCSLCAGIVMYVCICVACSPGGGCREGVVGHSSVVNVCSLYAGFVMYVCICVACSAGGGCRGGVVGHSSVVNVCSLYAGFVMYVCICMACSAGGGCRGGCDRSQFSGYCVQSVCWVCCVFAWPVLQEVVAERV